MGCSKAKIWRKASHPWWGRRAIPVRAPASLARAQTAVEEQPPARAPPSPAGAQAAPGAAAVASAWQPGKPVGDKEFLSVAESDVLSFEALRMLGEMVADGS